MGVGSSSLLVYSGSLQGRSFMPGRCACVTFVCSCLAYRAGDRACRWFMQVPPVLDVLLSSSSLSWSPLGTPTELVAVDVGGQYPDRHLALQVVRHLLPSEVVFVHRVVLTTVRAVSLFTRMSCHLCAPWS